jgi:endothelin-converting enzyme
MGAYVSKAQNEREEEEQERTPLIPGSDSSTNNHPAGLAKRVARWVAYNVVMVFMSLLVLAIIVLLCVFFGSM